MGGAGGRDPRGRLPERRRPESRRRRSGRPVDSPTVLETCGFVRHTRWTHSSKWRRGSAAEQKQSGPKRRQSPGGVARQRQRQRHRRRRLLPADGAAVQRASAEDAPTSQVAPRPAGGGGVRRGGGRRPTAAGHGGGGACADSASGRGGGGEHRVRRVRSGDEEQVQPGPPLLHPHGPETLCVPPVRPALQPARQPPPPPGPPPPGGRGPAREAAPRPNVALRRLRENLPLQVGAQDARGHPPGGQTPPLRPLPQGLHAHQRPGAPQAHRAPGRRRRRGAAAPLGLLAVSLLRQRAQVWLPAGGSPADAHGRAAAPLRRLRPQVLPRLPAGAPQAAGPRGGRRGRLAGLQGVRQTAADGGAPRRPLARPLGRQALPLHAVPAPLRAPGLPQAAPGARSPEGGRRGGGALGRPARRQGLPVRHLRQSLQVPLPAEQPRGRAQRRAAARLRLLPAPLPPPQPPQAPPPRGPPRRRAPAAELCVPHLRQGQEVPLPAGATRHHPHGRAALRLRPLLRALQSPRQPAAAQEARARRLQDAGRRRPAVALPRPRRGPGLQTGRGGGAGGGGGALALRLTPHSLIHPTGLSRWAEGAVPDRFTRCRCVILAKLMT